MKLSQGKIWTYRIAMRSIIKDLEAQSKSYERLMVKSSNGRTDDEEEELLALLNPVHFSYIKLKESEELLETAFWKVVDHKELITRSKK